MKQALWTFSLIRNFEKLQLAVKNVKIEINLSEGQVYMKLFTFLSRGIINKITFFFIHASLKTWQKKNYRISFKKKKRKRYKKLKNIQRLLNEGKECLEDALEVHEFNLQGIYNFHFSNRGVIRANILGRNSPYLRFYFTFEKHRLIIDPIRRVSSLFSSLAHSHATKIFSTPFFPSRYYFLSTLCSFTCTVLRIFRAKFFLTCPSRPLADSAHT